MRNEIWAGYFDEVHALAAEQAPDSLAFLDQAWSDGRLAADLLKPYYNADSKILEIGCGLGRVTRHVAPNCRELHCGDILPEALEYLKSVVPEPGLTTHRLSGYDLSNFQDDQFDLVYSFTTFFHFDFDLVFQYFQEIRRVLLPGGLAIIEFMPWLGRQDVEKLASMIRLMGGPAVYHDQVDKWRYVSKEMLAVLADFLDFEVLSDDVTAYRVRKTVRNESK